MAWAAITRHDGFIREAAHPVGWPVNRIRGTIAIESSGNPRAMQNNLTNGASYGLMQVVPFGVDWPGWHELVKQKAGLRQNASRQAVIDALYDPRINIAVGVAILEGFYQQHGTLDRASSAFFLGNPFWDGEDSVNGNAGPWYRDTLNALIAEQETFAPPDLIGRIVGGAPYSAPFGFGMPNIDAHGRPVTIYTYGVGHGTDAAHKHTGIDINIPLGTTVYCPLPGVVRWYGNRGSGDWGQGCGAFPDQITRGVGNVTVLTDAGLKITFGHVNRALVTVGDRVTAWQAVATSGGMIGPHLHLDASIKAPERVNRSIARNPGDYFLLDPIPAIAGMLGQGVPAPPPSFADTPPSRSPPSSTSRSRSPPPATTCRCCSAPTWAARRRTRPWPRATTSTRTTWCWGTTVPGTGSARAAAACRSRGRTWRTISRCRSPPHARIWIRWRTISKRCAQPSTPRYARPSPRSARSPRRKPCSLKRSRQERRRRDGKDGKTATSSSSRLPSCRLPSRSEESTMPPELLVSGVGITVLVPAVVELGKGLGLPTSTPGSPRSRPPRSSSVWSNCGPTPSSAASPAGCCSPWSTGWPRPGSTARCGS